MVAAAIEWSKLFQVIWVSLLAGIGITTLFSFAILGTTRASEARRAGSGGSSAGYALMALVGFAGLAGAVIFGIAIIVDK